MDWDEEVERVVFVHGHPRDVGWVVAHFRRPNRPDDGQLALIAPESAAVVEPTLPLAIPAPRPSPEAAPGDGAVARRVRLGRALRERRGG